MRKRLLLGQELKIAAEKGLKVHLVVKPYAPWEEGFDGIVVMEKAKSGYYIGDTDIEPDMFEEDEEVTIDYPEGQLFVYAVPKVKYQN